MYCEDNNGYWLSGEGGGSGRWWFEPMNELYTVEEKIRVCPQATKPSGLGKIGAWSDHAWITGDYVGSYGPTGHRSYDINGPWTRAGGVLPDDWTVWMRSFKDY